MAEENRVSASAIMKRLEEIAEGTLNLTPRNWLVYKPNSKTTGVAMKVLYRYSRAVDDKGNTLPYWSGGCFLELVAQKPSPDENARFDWKNELGGNVTIKLGLPDLSAFLLAYQEYRVAGRPIPTSIRPIVKNGTKWEPCEADNQLGLVHKFEEGTTFIKWTLSDDNRSMLEVAKSKELRRSISLTRTEELQFMRYLELAMDALLLTNA